MTKMRSHICAALAHSNLSVMGKMQLKMANSFYVRIAQNTKKPVNFMKGADASTTVVWPQEGVRIKDMNFAPFLNLTGRCILKSLQ